MNRYDETLSNALDLAKLQQHNLAVGMEVRVTERMNESNNPKARKYRTCQGPIIAINDRMVTVQTEHKPESWLLVDMVGTGRVDVRAVEKRKPAAYRCAGLE